MSNERLQVEEVNFHHALGATYLFNHRSKNYDDDDDDDDNNNNGALNSLKLFVEREIRAL
jgi:hypothetical protein